MKTGVRHFENASCKVLYCAAIPNQLRSKTREVVSVDVPENLRRQGMATRMLQNVCDEADAHNIILLIFPKPFGEGEKMDASQLADWYAERFGFQVIQVQPTIMMARMPGSSPGFFKPTQIHEMIERISK